MVKWNVCRADVSLDDCAGELCWIGVDLASRMDELLACARVIAEGLAQVPLKVYRSQGGVRTPDRRTRMWPRTWERITSAAAVITGFQADASKFRAYANCSDASASAVEKMKLPLEKFAGLAITVMESYSDQVRNAPAN